MKKSTIIILSVAGLVVLAGGAYALIKINKKAQANKKAESDDSKKGIGSYIPTNEEAQDLAQRQLAGEKLTAKEVAIIKKSAQLATVGRGIGSAEQIKQDAKSATHGRG